jgi:hypothetical protein
VHCDDSASAFGEVVAFELHDASAKVEFNSLIDLMDRPDDLDRRQLRRRNHPCRCRDPPRNRQRPARLRCLADQAPMSEYELRFPTHFEDAEAEITARGISRI